MKPVIYEVNLKVQKEIEKEFAAWLKGHIKDVLAIEGFEDAKWFEAVEDCETPDTQNILWTVHYHMKDRAALENYFEKHAARLRKPAKEKFGDQFTATRRILESAQKF